MREEKYMIVTEKQYREGYAEFQSDGKSEIPNIVWHGYQLHTTNSDGTMTVLNPRYVDEIDIPN